MIFPTILVILCLVGLIQSNYLKNVGLKYRLRANPTLQFSATSQEKTLRQKLDHFNPMDDRTFTQYYFVDKKRPNATVVILYISGEGPCGGVPAVHSLDYYSEQLNADVVTLEHRFYGRSLPSDSLTDEMLVYLRVEQVLRDLAEFRQYIQETEYSQDVDWVVMGGSYSGALSAWTRARFPHLFKGAVSFSGVVNAIQEFTAFDEQISISAGPQCATALRQISRKIESLMDAGVESNKKIKERFNFKGNDGDFGYLLADSAVLAIQYGYHRTLCDPLEKALTQGIDLIDTFVNYTHSFFYEQFDPQAPIHYTTEYIANHHPSAERSWWSTKCSELFYWQVSPKHDSIRMKYVTMDYHRKVCSTAFKKFLPQTNRATQIAFGATNFHGTNVYFANDSQDPWQRASMPIGEGKGWKSVLNTCLNCGHCATLRGCPGGCEGTGDQQIQNHLEESANLLKKWIAES